MISASSNITSLGYKMYDTSYQNVTNYSNTKSDTTDLKLKEVCDDFESFFMNQLLSISLKESSMGLNGAGNEIIKGMYIDGMSRNTGGAVGISSVLYDYLSQKG